MNSNQASEVVLIQAIESVDEAGEILSFEERRLANDALEGENAGSPFEAESTRAQTLSIHVQRRAPWLWRTTQNFSSFSWTFTLVCALIAIVFGAGVQALDAGKTFHVLSTPFLGLLLWNFLSLSFLLFGPWLLGRLYASKSHETSQAFTATPTVPSPPPQGPQSRWGKSMMSALLWLRQKWIDWRMPTTGDLIQHISTKAMRAYWDEWLHQAKHLLHAQMARTLHLAAIAFTVSALLVAYGRGLTKAYRATRESTFLGAAQVDFFLQIIFMPSQWILGPLPSTKATITGLLGPAAPWIHHYAVTLALFVILPRLVLFAWTTLKALRLTVHLPLSLASLGRVPTLNIALASHTNVGKTSLARTLLRRDVGEVRDAEHVTRRRAGYFLINTPKARLRLWDTPGFGDARALVQNLRDKQGWAWLRALQTPDLRFDREAALSLKEEADLILYLVPARAGAEVERTLRDEWDVLREIQRPVLCILNRLEGANAAEEEKLLAHWKAFFAAEPLCRDVLALDAFSRSWEDEEELFEAIERSIEPERRPVATALREIWKEQVEQRHQLTSTMVANALRKLSEDSEYDSGKDAAQRLQSRAQKIIAETQDQLLAHMGLKGEIRDRMLSQSEAFLRSIIPNRGERTLGAIIGGALSGLASGIMADILAGGLTFFGGAAVGMIVGALGGAGVAEGYRRMGTKGSRKIVWEQDFLKGVALRLTLLYLAAASFGRARGEFTDEAFLAPTPTALPPKDPKAPKSIKGTKDAKDAPPSGFSEHQALMFQATEQALKTHWPYLWPLLSVNHEPNTEKIWDKVVPGMAQPPSWVKQLQSNAQAPTLATAVSNQEAFEQGCAALLHEALHQWSQMRLEKSKAS